MLQEDGKMMKKQKLLFRLVIPTMLILFLLPPVSCLIFRHAAHDYAYSEATDELSELQNSILTAVGESFDGTLSKKTGNADKNSESNVRKKRGGILRRFTGPEEGSLSRTPKTALRSRNSSQSEIQRERNKSNNENSTVKRPSPAGAGSLSTQKGSGSSSSENQSGTSQRRPYRTPSETGSGSSVTDQDTDNEASESNSNRGSSGSGAYTPHRQLTRTPNSGNSGTGTSKDRSTGSGNSQEKESQKSDVSSGSTDENTGEEEEQAAFFNSGAQQFELLSNVKLIDTTYVDTSSQPEQPVQSGPENEYTDDTASPAQVREFLRKAGKTARTSTGRARLMILSPELTLRYPYDEEEQASVEQLYEDISRYISENAESITAESADDTVVITSEGQDNILSLSEIPMQSVEIKYIAAYCPTEQMDIWVNKASLIVLIISSALAIIALAVLLLTVRSVTRPVRSLCNAADRIGNGDLGSDIIQPFSVAELDELRNSMNSMSNRLKHSDEIQKNFFQNVSHELRNPLMSISGYAQGIEQGIFDHPEDVAHTILEESGRLTEIVSSLLTLSRLETADTEAQLSDMDINETIEECLDRVNGQAMERDISLLYDETDEECTVIGNEELCEQVICNFITNAVRYAASCVEISVYEHSDKVAISVADDGKGISPEDIDHVFERCYKGDGGNFGIGLAIAQTAAQRMHGEVSAANRAQGGAVFTLTLGKATA